MNENIRTIGYAGDISAADSWGTLEARQDAVLVDVRTPQEWEQVGVPDIGVTGRPFLRLSWKLLPLDEASRQFAADFSALPVGKDTTILLLCKSGGRSRAAACALTATGYRHCFNVAGGFEGPRGWKEAQLPWK